MFKRIEESHQERTFGGGIDFSRQYGEIAKKRAVQYEGFLKELNSLGIKGQYLEIGAGPAVLAVTIVQNYPDVQITAVDLSQENVSVAEKYVGSKGLQDRIQFVVGDGEDEDLINTLGKFDLVYGTFTLHHWKDPRKVIRNLTHAVADGGVLYLYDLRRVWWLYWVPIHSGFWDSIRAAYIPKEVRGMFHDLGVDQYEIKSVFPFMQSIIVRRDLHI